MKKRMMVVGPDDRDKELVVSLLEGSRNIPHIQSILYLRNCISIPSSYLRGAGMMKHIIATQQNANAVFMVLSTDRSFPIYSPHFAKAFRVPTIGLILIKDKEDLEGLLRCKSELEKARVGRILLLDPSNDQQIQELQNIRQSIEEGMI
ncbi:EutP/PduV family microcompartment system protein [Streptococcus caprae]|uniref:EutP/PduV family microcompartment system protein n=1 Tax=Streptococcus caprae TaxID=1640501 RepID=A0ABV8CYS2_9STRE